MKISHLSLAIGLSAVVPATARADDGPVSALGNLMSDSPTLTIVTTGVLVLSNATSVYLRTCTIDALLLERASHARAWGGEFDEAELRGGSTLVTLGTACEPLVSPDSAWRALDRPLTLQLLRPLPILEFLGSHARR